MSVARCRNPAWKLGTIMVRSRAGLRVTVSIMQTSVPAVLVAAQPSAQTTPVVAELGAKGGLFRTTCRRPRSTLSTVLPSTVEVNLAERVSGLHRKDQRACRRTTEAVTASSLYSSISTSARRDQLQRAVELVGNGRLRHRHSLLHESDVLVLAPDRTEESLALVPADARRGLAEHHADDRDAVLRGRSHETLLGLGREPGLDARDPGDLAPAACWCS